MSKKMSGVDHILQNRQNLADPEEVRQKLSSSLKQAADMGAEKALAEYKARREKLSEFQGQVAVLAGAAELNRCKASMMQGVCWVCHSRPATQNIYRTCKVCEN